MTALDKYAKLEAIARYRDGPSDRMREVVLSFGERTLMIVGMDDQPISHWPLINVHRLSEPGDEPVLLAPFEGSPRADRTQRYRHDRGDRHRRSASGHPAPAPAPPTVALAPVGGHGASLRGGARWCGSGQC